MNSSEYLQDAAIDFLRGTPATAPVSMTLALSSADPLMDGSGLAEPPGADGYARQTITLKAGVFTLGTGTVTSNDAPIVFGPAVNNAWPAVTHAAIFDNSGNMLIFGALAASRTVGVGDTYSFAIDALQLLNR